MNRPQGRGAAGRCPWWTSFWEGTGGGKDVLRTRQPHQTPVQSILSRGLQQVKGESAASLLDSVSLMGNNSKSDFYGQPEEPPLCAPQGQALPWDQASFALSFRLSLPLLWGSWFLTIPQGQPPSGSWAPLRDKADNLLAFCRGVLTK